MLGKFSTSLQQITWKDFFSYRKQRLTWERSSGFIGAAVGLGGGSYYFLLVADFDPLAEGPFGLPDMGLAYALGVVGCCFGGYAIGTLAAGPVWRLLKNPQILRQIDMKERDLYKRIKKHRPNHIPFINVPGTNQNVRLPDYYGQKITSVEAYRTWMRNQKLFMARLKTGRLPVEFE